jgi:hypothetical protein
VVEHLLGHTGGKDSKDCEASGLLLVSAIKFKFQYFNNLEIAGLEDISDT